MSALIKLKNTEPLASGSARLVFQHPHEADYLIKVIRPEILAQDPGSGSSALRFKKNRRYGHYNSFHREVQEYLATRNESDRPLPFLQEIIGFANTDLGLGLVLRAVRLPDGSLAPTLKQLLREHRFDERAEQGLEKFFEDMLQSRVVFSDMNVSSLVYLEEENRFVMIDGLGIANPIPLKALSSRVNRRSKLGRFQRLRNRIARYKAEFNHP